MSQVKPNIEEWAKEILNALQTGINIAKNIDEEKNNDNKQK